MLTDESIIFFDGACGSTLQGMDIPQAAWGEDYEGCNEWLNLSAPEVIVELHTRFLNAGAMAVETNTFGASDIVLAEYGLEDKVEEINAAAVANARKAIADGGFTGRYVVGSLGPTSKLPSLGHIEVDVMRKSYLRQAKVLLESGVDAILIETCQDILQTKTALVAAREAMEAVGVEVPLMVSVTIEESGTMLLGTDIATVVTTLEPFGLLSLGLNCGMGPAGMERHIKYLSENWPARISIIANAGKPELVDGETKYLLSPEDFSAKVKSYVELYGVSIIGGCCGTKPEHIQAVTESLKDSPAPAERNIELAPAVSSAYQSVTLAQVPKPFMIGERANANGSRKFRDLLLAEDFDLALQVGLDQEATGIPHSLDLCVAFAGRDEKADMIKLIRMFAESVKLPVVIDSTSPEVIEAALMHYPGRAIINSINLEDGGDNLDRICKLAKKYGAACVALTIDENGMAMTAENKLEIAKKIHDLAVDNYGLRSGDLIFDVLTFTIGSGDEKMCDAGIETLKGIELVKKNLPGIYTTLGLSNISFGLKPASRRILNSMYLHEAIKAGLDTAIVDAAKIVPLDQMDEADTTVALDLIYDRKSDDNPNPLSTFIEHFDKNPSAGSHQPEPAKDRRPTEQMLEDLMMSGQREGLEDVLAALMDKYKPAQIINELLIETMRKIGEKFGAGEMLLPFVLQSAEVMRRAVELLEPFMESHETQDGVKVLLATVAGDVHDIGKNLVDIILSHNGYKVYNIGIKMPAEEIIAKAKEYDVDVIGLSGLLVKSALTMKDDMARYADAGLKQPILLGGAALNRKFVASECAPDYSTGKVVYCSDAFDSLTAIQAFETGQLESSFWSEDETKEVDVPTELAINHDNEIPTAPFIGLKTIESIDDHQTIYDMINRKVLYSVRWGYKHGKLSADEYAAMIAEEVDPIFDRMLDRCIGQNLFEPQIAYGYFKCHSDGDRLIAENPDGGAVEFDLPRQSGGGICLADYYHTAAEGGDVMPAFVVTVGNKFAAATKQLFDANEYKDYLLLHSLGVELAETMAEYTHAKIRSELGLDAKVSNRYAFGYPACPELAMQTKLFELLKPENIGISLTENYEMTPELSTAAIIACHPQARYFSV